MTNALTPVDAASRALAQAASVDDFKQVHDAATAAKAWVKARGMGIDEENKATTVILRAERGAGMELIRMKEDGERATPGAFLKAASRGPDGRVQSSVEMTTGLTLDDLGISRNDASNWQLAARIPEDQFEAMLRLAIESGTRLAKVNFYRPEPKPKNDALPTKEDGAFVLFREACYMLLGWQVDQEGVGHPTKNGMISLPLDELQKIAELLQHMIAAYKDVRAQR